MAETETPSSASAAVAGMSADGNDNNSPSYASCPTCLIVIGMAGSGKTTFVQRLASYLCLKNEVPYLINLDPAVHEVPYPAHIDIRDTVNYKEVMKQYSLGPNGAIMTSLNLFTTRFDQVTTLIEKRKTEHKFIIIDTPGQIEVFTWSASGTIITDALASSYPTIVVYMMDTVRSTNPVTFMSNMLYACSILYKIKLPFIIAMNKTDVIDSSFAVEWMGDIDKFQDALEAASESMSYMSNLVRSMSLVISDFYENLHTVGVSSLTGQGFDQFLEFVAKGRHEYSSEYVPMLEELARKREKQRIKDELKRVKMDISSSKGGDKQDLEVDDDSDDDDNGALVNPSDENEEKLEDKSFQRFLSTSSVAAKTKLRTGGGGGGSMKLAE